MDPAIVASIAAAVGQQLFDMMGEREEPMELEEPPQTEEEEMMDAISNYCMIGRASHRFHAPYELLHRAWRSFR